MTMRGFEHTLTVVCPQCLSILDAKDPNLQVLQKFQSKTRITPLIPLGSRGNWRGTAYEVIGFQLRTVAVGGVITAGPSTCSSIRTKGSATSPSTTATGTTSRRARAAARRRSPWAKAARHVRGRHVHALLHLSRPGPPTCSASSLAGAVRRIRGGQGLHRAAEILSSESTTAETTWSAGEYVSGAEIWQAFKLPGAAARPVVSTLNQPSPLGSEIERAVAPLPDVPAAGIRRDAGRLCVLREQPGLPGQLSLHAAAIRRRRLS